jgi:hypothetical protein
MTELEKIEYARIHIDKLANGISPLDNTVLETDDIVNNIHISMCLAFVSNILRRVYENGGVDVYGTVNGKVKNSPFKIIEEMSSLFRFSDKPISLSDIIKRVNELIDNGGRLKRTYIQKWLIENELLKECVDKEGHHTTRPTDKGISEGILTELRYDASGSRQYEAVLYNRQMQEIIISHLDEMVEKEFVVKKVEVREHNNKPKLDKRENEGQRWDETQEKMLVEMFKDGLTIAEIARTMKRTNGGIRARLVKLGLIDKNEQAL